MQVLLFSRQIRIAARDRDNFAEIEAVIIVRLRVVGLDGLVQEMLREHVREVHDAALDEKLRFVETRRGDAQRGNRREPGRRELVTRSPRVAAAIRQAFPLLLREDGEGEALGFLHELVGVSAASHENLGRGFAPGHAKAPPGNGHCVEILAGKIPGGKKHPPGVERVEHGEAQPGNGYPRSAHEEFYQMAVDLLKACARLPGAREPRLQRVVLPKAVPSPMMPVELMRFAPLDHYFTGVSVPVAALRTQEDCGVGEFADLPRLAAWCAGAGLEVIQVLPVNDTGANSSPYSALSAYALHPLYLRLQDLPGAGPHAAEMEAFRERASSRGGRFSHGEVLSFKLDLAERLFQEAGKAAAGHPSFTRWLAANPWVRPYAVFTALKRERAGTPWASWGEMANPSEADILRWWENHPEQCLCVAWIQHQLEQQLSRASRLAQEKGVYLKGDVPILMSRESVDVWACRSYFEMDTNAGAPPDMFSPNGQNWGFPVYDWDALGADGYRWWKDRLLQAGKFFHALRIDHVLGFFRIWSIPRQEVTGLLGRFSPSAGVDAQELRALGFDDGRLRWLTLPHVTGQELAAALGYDASRVAQAYLTRIGAEEMYNIRKSVDSEAAIQALEEPQAVKDFLLSRHADRALLPDGNGISYPSWYIDGTRAFRSLSDGERSRLRDLLSRKRADSERIWEQRGRTLLSMLRDTTDMLVCAEDLGDVPDCVPKVLAELGILGLRINRWSREYKKAAPGEPAAFIPPASYPRLSVCTPSVHDTSTIRGWWEEDADEREAYFRSMGATGPCPRTMTPDLQARIFTHCLGAGSLLCMFQIQDILDLDSEIWSPTRAGTASTSPEPSMIRTGRGACPLEWKSLKNEPTLRSACARSQRRGAPGAPTGGEKLISPLPTYHFHVSRQARQRYDFPLELYSTTGNVITLDLHAARILTRRINEVRAKAGLPREKALRAGDMNAMGLIDEVLHYVSGLFRKSVDAAAFEKALAFLESRHGTTAVDGALIRFITVYPPRTVLDGTLSPRGYLREKDGGVSNRAVTLEEMLHLALANGDPAFDPFRELFDDAPLAKSTPYPTLISGMREFFRTLPGFGPDNEDLVGMLGAPVRAAPKSLSGQLEYIRTRWGHLLGDLLLRLLTGMDVLREEARLGLGPFAPGPPEVYDYAGASAEVEAFSPDKDWMPRVVMIAKNALVWLDQLSQEYGREIRRLDQVPDEELDTLARRGFTALWLIGVWERSSASREIKRRMGNQDAEASAYSLFDYAISAELGGEQSLYNLKERAWRRGIRLASDMVPNHTGVDSRWMQEHPERFLSWPHPWPPFPAYSFNGENLSRTPGIGIYLEDHYWARSDAAVVFKRVDFATGDTRLIYHGNDGTHMPWNDTAQLDFLKPETREAVISRPSSTWRGCSRSSGSTPP